MDSICQIDILWVGSNTGVVLFECSLCSLNVGVVTARQKNLREPVGVPVVGILPPDGRSLPIIGSECASVYAMKLITDLMQEKSSALVVSHNINFR